MCALHTYVITYVGLYIHTYIHIYTYRGGDILPRDHRLPARVHVAETCGDGVQVSVAQEGGHIMRKCYHLESGHHFARALAAFVKTSVCVRSVFYYTSMQECAIPHLIP